MLQILETVDEIKIGKLRGARDPRNGRRNQCSEVSRSSRSGTPRGHASGMGGCNPHRASSEYMDIDKSVSLRGRPTALFWPGPTANNREIDPALRRNRAPISVGAEAILCMPQARQPLLIDRHAWRLRLGKLRAACHHRRTVGQEDGSELRRNNFAAKVVQSSPGPHDSYGRGTCDHLARVHPT